MLRERETGADGAFVCSQGTVSASFSLELATDAIIAFTMCYYLYQKQSVFPKSVLMAQSYCPAVTDMGSR